MKLGTFNRRTAGRLMLLTWAVALAWLARRELGKTEAQVIAEATLRLNPEAHFYAVLARGHQVGYASMTVDTVPAGFSLSEVLALDVPEGDSTRRVTRRTELIVSRSLRLREFTRTLSGGGLFEELEGRIEGDTVLRLAQRDSRDAEPVAWRVPLGGDVVLPQLLAYRLAFSQRLEVGRSVTARVLDLATGTIAPHEFRATAESTFVVADSAVEQRGARRWVPVTWDTVKAFRIEHEAAGTPMVSWVDSRGGLVRSEAALGVRLERSAFELVSFNYRDALAQAGPGHHRQVAGMQSLVESGLRPGPAGESADWSVTGTPAERFLLPRLAWLDGGRQASRQDHLRVGEEPPRSAAPSARVEYLAPASMVPDSVQALARQIVAGVDDPAARIERLVRWVAREVRVDADRGGPVLPARVLLERRAGAEGHARLFAELARAVDLAARPVSGVAVLDSGVYGHAWSEVWLEGRWLAVDPTFGQVPASTRLVRVTVGGAGRAIDLVPVLGSVTFTPVSPATAQ